MMFHAGSDYTAVAWMESVSLKTIEEYRNQKRKKTFPSENTLILINVLKGQKTMPNQSHKHLKLSASLEMTLPLDSTFY